MLERSTPVNIEVEGVSYVASVGPLSTHVTALNEAREHPLELLPTNR